MHVADPEHRGLELDRAAPTPRSRGEQRPVVGEQRRREPVGRYGSVEACDDVRGLEHRTGIRADQQPRVVVEHVQDLDLGTSREVPVGDVGLPAFAACAPTTWPPLRPDAPLKGPTLAGSYDRFRLGVEAIASRPGLDFDVGVGRRSRRSDEM